MKKTEELVQCGSQSKITRCIVCSWLVDVKPCDLSYALQDETETASTASRHEYLSINILKLRAREVVSSMMPGLSAVWSGSTERGIPSPTTCGT